MRQTQIKKIVKTTGVTFGTSGARGLAENMTDEVCAAYAAAFLQEVVKTTDCGRVALGMDLRPSSPAIAGACAAAVRAADLEVVFCGALPTPALAFYAQEEDIPAIMVTGSHVPFDRNGIYVKKRRATCEEIRFRFVLFFCIIVKCMKAANAQEKRSKNDEKDCHNRFCFHAACFRGFCRGKPLCRSGI